jgi:hypothetical protein
MGILEDFPLGRRTPEHELSSGPIPDKIIPVCRPFCRKDLLLISMDA